MHMKELLLLCACVLCFHVHAVLGAVHSDTSPAYRVGFEVEMRQPEFRSFHSMWTYDEPLAVITCGTVKLEVVGEQDDKLELKTSPVPYTDAANVLKLVALVIRDMKMPKLNMFRTIVRYYGCTATYTPKMHKLMLEKLKVVSIASVQSSYEMPLSMYRDIDKLLRDKEIKKLRVIRWNIDPEQATIMQDIKTRSEQVNGLASGTEKQMLNAKVLLCAEIETAKHHKIFQGKKDDHWNIPRFVYHPDRFKEHFNGLPDPKFEAIRPKWELVSCSIGVVPVKGFHITADDRVVVEVREEAGINSVILSDLNDLVSDTHAHVACARPIAEFMTYVWFHYRVSSVSNTS